MISFFIGYAVDFVHFFYRLPLVKGLTKKSIMGNYVDKTLDYYMNSIIISPLDEEYLLRYSHKNKEYILICDVDNYMYAVDFIKSRYTLEPQQNILSACTKNTGIFEDITEKVRMLAGPEQDFYANTKFHVQKKHITDKDLYILNKNFERFVYTDDNNFIDIL